MKAPTIPIAYPRLKLPDNVTCMKCGRKPDIAIQSENVSDGRSIIACRACAFKVARDLRLPALLQTLLDYFEVKLPAMCPNCGRATETATARPEFGGQQCAHWTFKNGSLVVSPWRELPAPTKCAPCDRGWVVDHRRVAVMEVPRL